ncbi:MAG TPA: hypothetical protein PKD16_15345 [Saprospiraceae bacterium]|nr:hypothetical protein [Saprospiraceae bacterium]HMT54544.1 hypothetical protein [Saprospiraceae bacterium]HMT71542.1 hypothetical protein [Saprospiraceae bacterium]
MNVRKIPLQYVSLVKHIKSKNQILINHWANGMTKYSYVDVNTAKISDAPDLGPPRNLQFKGNYIYRKNGTKLVMYSIETLDSIKEIDLGVNFNQFDISGSDPEFIVFTFNKLLNTYKNGKLNIPIDANYFEDQVMFSNTKNIVHTAYLGNPHIYSFEFDENGQFIEGAKTYQSFSNFVNKENVKYKNKTYVLDYGFVVEENQDSPYLVFSTNVADVRLGQFTNGAGTYVGCMIDSIKDVVRYVFVKGFTNVLEFDINKKTFLVGEKVADAEIEMFPDQYTFFTSLDNGRDFAVSNEDYLFLFQDCNQNLTKPILDTMYNNIVYACSNNSHVIYPPPGYANFYIDNVIYDSLDVNNIFETKIKVANVNGCLSQESDKISIDTGTTPSKPTISFINSSTTLCKGGLIEPFINSFNNNVEFLWSNGQIGSTAFYDKPGTIWAIARQINGGCYSQKSTIYNINYRDDVIVETPTIQFTSENSNICNNTSIEAVAPSNASKYVWRYSINGSADQSTQNKISGVIDWMKLKVLVDGCWSNYSTVFTGVYTNPTPPTITHIKSANLLYTGPGFSNYKWYLDSKEIPSQNEAVLNVIKTGNYRVKYFNGNCWSPFSNNIKI